MHASNQVGLAVLSPSAHLARLTAKSHIIIVNIGLMIKMAITIVSEVCKVCSCFESL